MIYKLPAVYISDLYYGREYKSYELDKLMKNGDYSKIITMASDNLDRRYPYTEDAKALLYEAESGIIIVANVLRIEDCCAEMLLEVLTKDPNMKPPTSIDISLEQDDICHVDSLLITMVAKFIY